MVAFASEWDISNQEALALARGPLWVVLGDSTAQGIGASSRGSGYVLSTLDQLRAQRGDEWRVVNLSRSGATVGDVVGEQIPRLRDLPEAALVSCAAGANDLLRRSDAQFRADVERLCASLPPRALIATLPRGLRGQRAEVANDLIRAGAATHDLVVVDLWDHTGPPWRGQFAADMFHPNDLGYTRWTAAFCEALELGA